MGFAIGGQMLDDGYQKNLDAEIAKRKLLECQYQKLESGGKLETCFACKDSFACLTMRAKKFTAVLYQSKWESYEIYAENAEHAQFLFREYLGEDEIVYFQKEGEEVTDSEIEEVRGANK